MAERANTDPFVIDPGRLDAEWLEMARFARRAGVAEADARHAHSQARARLDVCEATLVVDIKRNPAKYGVEKPTEKLVEALVVLAPEHQKLTDELFAAQRLLDLCRTDVTACVDRRKALERLVELLSINYFATAEPRAAAGPARDAMDSRRRRDVRTTDD